MPTVVIPFAGATGKTRLHSSPEVRAALAEAMFRDVLAACVEVGRTRVVTPDEEAAEIAVEAGAEVVEDPGDGQGAAVMAAVAGLVDAVLVVNADLPCVAADDLRSLLAAAPALVEAADGTTNALSLPAPELFAPLYGPGSAARFRSHASAASVDLPNLTDDVDTLDDLARLGDRAGPFTRGALAELQGSLV